MWRMHGNKLMDNRIANSTSTLMEIVAKVPSIKLCLKPGLTSKLTQHTQAKSKHNSSSLRKLITFRGSKRKPWLVTSVKLTIVTGTQTQISSGFTQVSKQSQKLHLRINRSIFSILKPSNSSSWISHHFLISMFMPNPSRIPALISISEGKSQNNNTTYLRCKLSLHQICSKSKQDPSWPYNKSWMTWTTETL